MKNARKHWTADEDITLRRAHKEFGHSPEACQRIARMFQRTPSGVYNRMVKLKLFKREPIKYSPELMQFVIDNYPTNPRWTGAAIAEKFGVPTRHVNNLASKMFDLRRPRYDTYQPTVEERAVLHEMLTDLHDYQWAADRLHWPRLWVKKIVLRDFPRRHRDWSGARRIAGMKRAMEKKS